MMSRASVAIVAAEPSSLEMTIPTTSATTMTKITVMTVAVNRSKFAVARKPGSFDKVICFMSTGIVRMPDR